MNGGAFGERDEVEATLGNPAVGFLGAEVELLRS